MKRISLPEKKKAQKMEMIINDALHYFEKNGYDNTTVDQLCEAALISTSTFFNYFGTKETVVALIMEDGLREFREMAERSMAEDADPFEAAQESLFFLCDKIGKYCNTVSVFFRIMLQNDDFREIELKHSRIAAELIENAFDKTGRSCPYSTDLLIDMIGGCFTHPFLTLPPEKAASRARNSVKELISLFSMCQMAV